MLAWVKSAKISRLQFLFLVAVGLLLGVVLFGRVTAAQGSGILGMEDLPSGFTVVIDEQISESKDVQDDGHPLTLANLTDFTPSEQEVLLNYVTMRSFGALNPERGVLVMNFAYEYATSEGAERAARALQRYGQMYGQMIDPEELGFLSNGSADAHTVQGQGFAVKSGKETAYWFYGTLDRQLIVLLVDGLDSQETRPVYEVVLAHLRER